MAMQEIKRTEHLLTNLVPEHALEKLKEGLAVADEFENMPILFADIVGFTNFSSNKNPKEIISVLYELFSRFDDLCVLCSCYKVCTIGDCYVAIGYNGKIEKNKRNPQVELLNIINFGFGLIQILKDLNQVLNSQLQMRIGVHVGRIIGGISGSTIIRYDIYGGDVMIANKMESNGQAGNLNVSFDVKRLLESFDSGLSFNFNKTVEIKLNSSERATQQIECYFVFPLDKEKKYIPEDSSRLEQQINT